jgi:hypothetical protein
VLIQERTPTSVRAIDIEYADGAGRVGSDAHYQVERWISDAPAMQ